MTRKIRFKCLFCDKMIKTREWEEHIKEHEKYNEEHVSKNTNAERICGIRPRGTPISEPFEIGFKCPICKTRCCGKDYINEITGLQFSEYEGFMYCPKCNIDLPSYFCLHPSSFTKEKIKFHVVNYLEMIEGFQQRVLKSKDVDLTNLQLQQQVKELTNQVKYYRNFAKGWHDSFKDHPKYKEKKELLIDDDKNEELALRIMELEKEEDNQDV